MNAFTCTSYILTTYTTIIKLTTYHLTVGLSKVQIYSMRIHRGTSATEKSKIPGCQPARATGYKEQIHSMHDTSPAHPQEKKKKYQIDYLQRLVQYV